MNLRHGRFPFAFKNERRGIGCAWSRQQPVHDVFQSQVIGSADQSLRHPRIGVGESVEIFGCPAIGPLVGKRWHDAMKSSRFGRVAVPFFPGESTRIVTVAMSAEDSAGTTVALLTNSYVFPRREA